MRYSIGENNSQLLLLAEQLANCRPGGSKCRRLIEQISKALMKEEDESAAGQIWDEKIEPALLNILRQTRGSKARAEAVEMLALSSDSNEARDALLCALSDPDSLVRAKAAGAAGNALIPGHPSLALKIAPVLLQRLSDVKKVREEAWLSLSELAHEYPDVRHLLLEYLQGPLPEKREALWNALMADDSYIDYTPDEQKEHADALVLILMRLPDNKAWACWKAGESLGQHIGGEIGFKALLRALKSPYACGRHSAIHGLSHVNNSAAIPYLEEIAVHDRSHSVREYAREVINQMMQGG